MDTTNSSEKVDWSAGKGNAAGIGDVLGEDAGFIVGANNLIEQTKIGDDYRRGIRVVDKQLGTEGSDTVDTATNTSVRWLCGNKTKC